MADADALAEKRVQVRRTKAAEYRAHAEAAAALAKSSILPEQRQKQAVAAAKWTEMAELEERPPADPAPRARPAPRR